MTMITVKILDSNIEIVPVEVDDQSSFYLNIYSTHAPYADNFINNDSNQGLDVYFVEIGTDQWKLKTYGSVTYEEDTKRQSLLSDLNIEQQRRLDLILTATEIQLALAENIRILNKENKAMKSGQTYDLLEEERVFLKKSKEDSIKMKAILNRGAELAKKIVDIKNIDELNAFDVKSDDIWQ